MTVVSADPFRCRMWALHGRLECDSSKMMCTSELQSFLEHGQLVPVLGRPLSGDAAYDVELIYGSRRLFAARQLNKQLNVDLREVTDREGLIAMDIENRLRRDISPYERGRSYAKWLQSGLFKSQEDLAHTVNVSPSQVSRLLRLARLPSVIVDAFGSPLEICERWGVQVADMLDGAITKQRVLSRARSIALQNPRPSGREVFRALIAASKANGKVRKFSGDEVVADQHGTALFRIRHQTDSVALLLPVDVGSTTLLRAVTDAIVDILHAESTRGPDESREACAGE